MRRYLTLIAPLFVALIGVAPAMAATDHCPNHSSPDVTKVEAQGNNLNLVVLPAGTKFCVKGGTSTSGNILTANGQTTLKSYLGTGKDVSYYVIYEEAPSTPPTTTTTTLPSTDTTTTTVSPDTTGTTTVTAPTTTTTAPAEDIPSLHCADADGYPYQTNIEHGECPDTSPTATDNAPPTAVEITAPANRTELPRTGVDAGLLFVIGTAVLLAGLSCWFAGKAIG